MKTPTTLRTRLFWNTLTILLIGMGVAALLVWQAVETLYLDTQRENLLAQANLTAAALQGQPLPPIQTQAYSQTMNTQPGIHTRLLNQNGAVVFSLPVASGDASTLPISSKDLLARPEIVSAMRGNAATAIRAVADRRVLYAAAPVLGDDEAVAGLVYLTMPLPAAGLPLNLTLELAGAALLAVLLAILTGTLLARRMVSPVETIARAAAAVSAGDLDQHVLVGSDIIELNDLGQAFNQMTASLRQTNAAKNAFVADVTHELRTPLTVIKGTIETLQDGALDDLTGRGPLLDSMERETDRLIRMVNDLLLLARADAQTLNVDIQPLDLAELARARCAGLNGLATRHQVRLSVIGAEPAPVQGDVDRLSQVLDNLLDNAIRYSPQGGIVTVEISISDDECQCAVHDEGAGIDGKHLPFIFERFYRADTSRNRQTGGAGLGLAIVHALVQAQGGRISAESRPGNGTTIRFWLPCGLPAN